MTMLRISLLGEVHVDYEDERAAIELTPRLQLLLAYIVLQRHKSHPRLALMDLFWSDYSEKQAQKCLRTALWRLRQALAPDGETGASYLVSTPSHDVGFNCDQAYWLDVEQFEQGLGHWNGQKLAEGAARQLEETLDLYTGGFLEGYYEDWIILERERLENLYITGLVQLLRHYRARRSFEKGLACGLKILRVDPLREEVHRELMRIYAGTGRRPQAIRQYQQCAAILEKELNIEPMPETQLLYRQIAGDSLESSSAWGGAPFAGEIDTVHRRLQEAMVEFEQAFRHLQEVTALLHQED